MTVNLVRIDDRLIHGQIVYSWIESSKADTILIADDFAAVDKTQQLMLRLVAPKSMGFAIKSIEETVPYLQELEDKKVFIIVRNPESMLKLLDSGFTTDYVNLGNISASKSVTGRKTLLKNIHVEQNDVDCIKAIAEKGVKIEIQLVPDDKAIDAIELINKNY